jgi:hypothetical protein
VLFGGFGFNGCLGDTWEWDGTTWIDRTSGPRPVARESHAMAYDSARGRVVLFGGYSIYGNILADTWEWDGSTWVQRTPARNPVARYGHAMAYDCARRRVVLFGADSIDSTWEWDGGTWVLATPATSPPYRRDLAMAYDSGRGHVVLFGGDGSGGQYLGDTWEYDHCTVDSDCADGNPCTDDSCDPTSGCVYTNNTAPCDDGNACTTNDTCSAGSCAGGAALVCDDGNACTDDNCDPATGCVYTNNTAPCDDGNACTTNDACSGGACLGGPALVCDDGNVCNGVETCHPLLGCQAGTPLVCDDGNVCNGVETCDPQAGCQPGTPLVCDDGSLCNGVETCDPQLGCQPGKSTVLVCDDGNPCTDDSCDPTSGCVYTNNTAPCDDGNTCTTNDTCANGMCLGGQVLACNDGNVCTDDSCNPSTGCVYTNNTAPCDDGNTCTTNDTCANGMCLGGPALACNDGNVCTDDSCNATTGCVHTFRDTIPPTIVCPAPIIIECRGNLQSVATVPPATATDVCQPSGLVIMNSYTPNGANASGSYPLGTTTVVFTATDAAGNHSRCQTTITIRDTIPPVLTVVSSPNVLWPPNHRMVTVDSTMVATDNCDPHPMVVLTGVTSSEPDDAPGGGDGNTTSDVQGASVGTADYSILLRAERDGAGSGRVYTVTYQATDASGNATTASSMVTVPHDMRDKAVEPLNLLIQNRDSTEVIWGPVEGAQHYDVVRGDLANLTVNGSNIDLGQVVCIDQATTNTTTVEYEDTVVPAPGHVFFYAVQYFDGVGNSSYGSESAGKARVIQPGNGDCE